MSVRVIDNTAKILIDTNRGVNLALRYMLDGIDEHAFSKTPKDQGELRKNLRKTVSGKKGTIKWQSKYAQSQEKGFTSGPVRNYTTVGTGPHFAENAVRHVVQRSDMYLRKARLI